VLGAHRAQRPLIFNIDDLKLGDLTKLWFFKLIVTKSNFKRSVIIFVTSLPLRQPNDVTKITSQKFSILGPPIKISGYASALAVTYQFRDRKFSEFDARLRLHASCVQLWYLDTLARKLTSFCFSENVFVL